MCTTYRILSRDIAETPSWIYFEYNRAYMAVFRCADGRSETDDFRVDDASRDKFSRTRMAHASDGHSQRDVDSLQRYVDRDGDLEKQRLDHAIVAAQGFADKRSHVAISPPYCCPSSVPQFYRNRSMRYPATIAVVRFPESPRASVTCLMTAWLIGEVTHNPFCMNKAPQTTEGFCPVVIGAVVL